MPENDQQEPQKQEDLSINNINDAVAATISAFRKFNRARCWWRGHSCFNWHLRPWAHRLPRNEEANMYTDFKRRARSRYRNCPPENDAVGWLFLMQHYGLPTRLLDWSESILTALFFALDDKHLSLPGALWAVNPAIMNKHLCDQQQILGATNRQTQEIIMEPFMEGTTSSFPAAAILAPEVDIRMLVQMATCTIHSTPTPLEELSGNGDFLMRFVIPPEAKAVLGLSLNLLAVRRASLFPDLENLSKEIRSTEFLRPESGETS